MRAVLSVMLTLLLIGTLLWAFEIVPIKAQASGTVYIRSDGSIDPSTAPIQRWGDIYSLTGNLVGNIDIEKDNILLDGAGYTFQATRKTGITLTARNNVTVKNIHMSSSWTWGDFDAATSRHLAGILLDSTTNSTITGNYITNCSVNILLIHSSNNIITENNVKIFSTGIQLEWSSNNTITANNISGIKPSSRGIRPLYSSNFNLVSENNVTACSYGIDDLQTISSTRNTVSRNNITANTYGICLYQSNIISENNVFGNSVCGISIDGAPNSVYGNKVRNNGEGISIRSGNNVLRSNIMENNKNYNFRLIGVRLSHFINDVDTSNTVEGKPIYYLFNDRNKIVAPHDAGCIILANCTNMTVQNVNLSNNGLGIGILLAYTTNSSVTNNIITNKTEGIRLFSASNNSLSGNYIRNNGNGIAVFGTKNKIVRNEIANNAIGIGFTYPFSPDYVGSLESWQHHPP